MEDARALLNGLMGADRNVKKKLNAPARKFSDEDICKKFLLGMCPHDMFTNTKTDLGPCNKTHNDILKDNFENDEDHQHYRRKWQKQLTTQLKMLLANVERLKDTNAVKIKEKESLMGSAEDQKKLDAMKEEVSDQLKQAEQAADNGMFEASRALVREAEDTKKRIAEIENQGAEVRKEPTICEMCGLMVSGEEYADILKYGRGWHTDGKQHVGFISIRAKLNELEAKHDKDRKDGIRTPSPSPVKVQKVEPTKRRSRSPPAKAQSRSPKRGARSPPRRRDDGQRRGRSRSAQRGGRRRSPSPKRGRDAARSTGRRREASRSKGNRSRSRGAKRSLSRDKRRTEASARPASPPPRRRSPTPPPPPSAPAEVHKSKERQPPEPEPAPVAAEPPRPVVPEPEPELPLYVQKPLKFVLGLGKLNMSMTRKK